MLAKYNGRAIDEPVELKNLVVNSTSVDNVRTSSRLVNGELHSEAKSPPPERDLQLVAGRPRRSFRNGSKQLAHLLSARFSAGQASGQR